MPAIQDKKRPAGLYPRPEVQVRKTMRMHSAHSSGSNPFAQAKHYWRVHFTVPAAAVKMAEESFNDLALAISTFELEQDERQWHVELLCDSAPDMTEIGRRLLVLSMMFDLPAIEPAMGIIEHKDWAEIVARGFAPMTVGRYYVHGSHVTARKPHDKIALQIDAGNAFGSGEHATTSACLRALDALARKRGFINVLDMGCGSGILAIAAARTWRCNVIASDVDGIAARVTKENARINQVASQVRALESDGYQHPEIARNAPYDLICSNILARPLTRFAPALAAHLAPYGVAVLSGFLQSQEAQVMAAHRVHGLKLITRYESGRWHTLVMGK
jgi:ribosomal protein L11 methyltransferase